MTLKSLPVKEPSLNVYLTLIRFSLSSHSYCSNPLWAAESKGVGMATCTYLVRKKMFTTVSTGQFASQRKVPGPAFMYTKVPVAHAFERIDSGRGRRDWHLRGCYGTCSPLLCFLAAAAKRKGQSTHKIMTPGRRLKRPRR